LVRDAAGNGYWAEGGGEGAAAVVRRKAPDGGVATVASGAFGRVKWLAAAPDGTLFFTAMAARTHDLYRVTPAGEVRRLAHGLAAPSLLDRLPTALFSPWHATFGLWPDGRGGAYVAVTADRVVKHVSATGEVAVAARSRPPWSPTGGLLAADGSLWILEGGLPGRVRVVHISPDGRRRVF
jgi:sugar lactone lactonase YvrE